MGRWNLLTALLLAACNSDTPANPGMESTDGAIVGCSKDTDCKGDRICVRGMCTAPMEPPDLAIAAPDFGAGCGPRDWMGFANRVDYATAVDPQALAIGDLDADHQPDIAATTIFGGLDVLLNKGMGTFGAPKDHGVGKGTSVAVADLNSDGRPDVVAVNSGGMATMGGSDSVSIFFNRGNGALGAPVDLDTGAGPRSVAVGDLNGDERPDLAVVNISGETVSVLLNLGGGKFTAHVDYPAGPAPWWVAIGDFDGDAKRDLVVTNYGGMGGTGTVGVLRNQGAGAFSAPVTYSTARQPVSVAAGDLNSDGKLDLAVANQGSDSLSVLLNQGNGTFAAHVNYGAGMDPTSVAMGDFNDDGQPDLVAANGDYGGGNLSSVSVLLNQGNGTFGARIDGGVGRSPSSVAVSDLNGDGRVDVAVSNYSSNTVSVLMNLGCR